MAEAQDNFRAAAPVAAAAAPAWGQVWQMPVLILGLLLFLVGVGLALVNRKGPDLNGQLDTAWEYLKADNFVQAHATLDKIEPHIAAAPAPAPGRYHLLQGDLIYLEQQARKWDLPANHKAILDNYCAARKHGQTLDSVHLQRLAETQVALGQQDEALKTLDELKEDPGRRSLVLRRMIERRLNQGAADPAAVAPLLDRYLKEEAKTPDPAARRAAEIWVAATRYQALLNAGHVEQVIDPLQRQIIMFLQENGRNDDLSALFVLLARAYYLAGDYPTAQRYYSLAQRKLRPENPADADLLAQTLVGLGQVALTGATGHREEDNVRVALDYFTKAETDYRVTPAYLDALFGRAACEARLGSQDQALEHFSQAVKKVAAAVPPAKERVEQATNLIRQQYTLNSDRKQYALALDYLRLLTPLYPDAPPLEILVLLADTQANLARQDMTQALASAQAGVDQQQALAEAASLYNGAGELYLRHAKRVTIQEVAAYSASLWKAADCFAKAQQWKKVAEVLDQFVKALPSDPRQMEATQRMAMAQMADGQYAAAADQFKRLIEEHPRSPEAYASLVPLASCQTALQQYDDAKRVLSHIVTDHPVLRPESGEYQQALIALGQLHYQLQEFEPAVERLSEAVERYGQTARGPALRFLLADSYRQSVATLNQLLKDPQLPPAKQQKIAAERVRRLEQAQALYSQVVAEFDKPVAGRRSAVERLYHRNAFFYRADCAYDLHRFDQAIQLYDQAAKRFDDQPASLMALVQIVNAYCEMGKLQEAKVANDRARAQLQRIPPEAFNDPSLPMSRQHWEDWLRWTSQFNLFVTQGEKKG